MPLGRLDSEAEKEQSPLFTIFIFIFFFSFLFCSSLPARPTEGEQCFASAILIPSLLHPILSHHGWTTRRKAKARRQKAGQP